jgi:hypothetical protein
MTPQAPANTLSIAGANAPLTHKTIGAIRGEFFVPGYQRGYRWTPDDVRHLLNDIAESNGQDYSLQPVVVKLDRPAEHDSDAQWELIDGQQRLTTLYLILRYMRRELAQGLGAPYSMRYETREGSREYLDTLEESEHLKNIDYFHMYTAYQAIDAWFAQHGDIYQRNHVAGKLHSFLFNSVRVIWYEAPPHIEAIPLFTRLNVGRIPLTDAELVKAALLSGVRRMSPERAQEVAAQWDAIERDLHHPEIWAFVAGLGNNSGNERYPTRISLLLDALADAVKPHDGRRPRYHTFDNLLPQIESDLSTFWADVVALHAQILGWYELPRIYNKLGFLVASGQPFGKLALEAKDKKKSEFEQFLSDRIRTYINIRFDAIDDLSYDESRGYRALMNLLLLMNVETSSRSRTRFPFSRHVGQTWSLEHIHAQNAEVLNKAEQWKTWLSTHQLALRAMTSLHNANVVSKLDAAMTTAIAEIDRGKAGSFSGEKFNALSKSVLELLDKDLETDHTIRNLALLSSADNSSLSNSVFEVKRQMILELDRKGEYVPCCTRNVFLKYYADADAQQPHFWSEQDKRSYAQEIRSILKPYLN